MYNHKISSNKKKILFLFLFLIILFLSKINIFESFYNLYKYDYRARMTSVNGNCYGGAWGFLNFIKKKHKFKNNPKIINYKAQPNLIWSIYIPNKKVDPQHLILINYQRNLNIRFNKKREYFENDFFVENTAGIESIQFKVSEPFDLNNKIEIYKMENGKKIPILSDKIKEKINSDTKIKLNYKGYLLDSRVYKIYIKSHYLQI